LDWLGLSLDNFDNYRIIHVNFQAMAIFGNVNANSSKVSKETEQKEAADHEKPSEPKLPLNFINPDLLTKK
jgi:hypothetical protein